MNVARQAQPAFFPMLWTWVTYHIGRMLASMKPAVSASEVATAIARSGNPAGV